MSLKEILKYGKSPDCTWQITSKRKCKRKAVQSVDYEFKLINIDIKRPACERHVNSITRQVKEHDKELQKLEQQVKILSKENSDIFIYSQEEMDPLCKKHGFDTLDVYHFIKEYRELILNSKLSKNMDKKLIKEILDK